MDQEAKKILNQFLTDHKDEMVHELSEIVKIPSVYSEPKEGAPYGVEARRAMQYAMDLSKRLGFEKVVNVDDQCCYTEIGSGDRLVAVFAHLDIVPEGDGWTYPPFGGEIHNNRVYGRGTVDDKGPYIAALYSLYAIKESGLPLNCRIRVVGGTYEELGMDDMKHYVEVCGAPDAGFTPDGLWPMSFTERCINYYTLGTSYEQAADAPIRLISIDGGKILNMVPDKASAVLSVADAALRKEVIAKMAAFNEKAGTELTGVEDGTEIRISSKGLCAHSCTPFNGRNAIVAILMFLDELKLGGSLGDFLAFFRTKIAFTTDGSLLNMVREDECGKLTFSLSKMNFDEKGGKWIVNIRLPFTYKDEVTEDFRAQVEPAGVKLLEINAHPSYRVPKDSPLILTLRDVFEGMTGKDSTPGHEGGTYAKVVPNIVAFGSIWPGTPDLCHRPDECVDVDEYLLDATIYANAMYALTKG